MKSKNRFTPKWIKQSSCSLIVFLMVFCGGMNAQSLYHGDASLDSSHIDGSLAAFGGPLGNNTNTWYFKKMTNGTCRGDSSTGFLSDAAAYKAGYRYKKIYGTNTCVRISKLG